MVHLKLLTWFIHLWVTYTSKHPWEYYWYFIFMIFVVFLSIASVLCTLHIFMILVRSIKEHVLSCWSKVCSFCLLLSFCYICYQDHFHFIFRLRCYLGIENESGRDALSINLCAGNLSIELSLLKKLCFSSKVQEFYRRKA